MKKDVLFEKIMRSQAEAMKQNAGKPEKNVNTFDPDFEIDLAENERQKEKQKQATYRK